MWLGFDSHEAVYLLLLSGTCTRSAESYDSVCTLLCIIDGRWQTLANVHLLVWHAFPLALPWLQRFHFSVLLLFSHVAAAFTARWVKVGRHWTYSCRLMRQDGILTQGRIPCTCGAWRKTCYLPPVVL